MIEWFTSSDGIWEHVWKTLDQGVRDADHPARLPTFATVSPEGWPEARTVVLRSADENTRSLTVHTDLFSSKIRSLRDVPRAALHVWDKSLALQLRLQTEVTIEAGPQTDALWRRIPDHAQQSYGVTPPPGTPIEDALAYEKTPDPDSFAVLRCKVVAIDAVHLGQQHRRIRFSDAQDWQGEWLSP
ncbi:pyridoxamine 5'-phosphate oxidase family protein [Yoonia litorea]|uniref:Pyridoxine/pyridoxamine 5'-phosphate oxidase n=1 Tax=Yoonia litorea TaxID=1123755 RepID=A0A1I6MZ79_9RHOB|nr:pyridoxamine 5'-phosphate oxidase family protein [Yoonia litorea]SFS20989.1 Pyridoxine/pyridoxamine 5'-phosphate oxidase [Yoonia litorea]